MPNTLNMIDGFDTWATIADMAASATGANPGSWDSCNLNGLSSASASVAAALRTRFNSGQSVNLYGASTRAVKTVANNDQIHHVAFAIYQYVQSSATTNTMVAYFYDTTANSQCAVSIGIDGFIRLIQGNSGTVLATSPTKLIPLQTWTHVEMEVCVSNTAGYCKVRINGNPVDDWATVQTLNTRNSANASTNNYANTLSIGAVSGGNDLFMDDLIWGSSNTPGMWFGDSRVIALTPSSDAQAQYTPYPSPATIIANGSQGNGGPGANSLSIGGVATMTGAGQITSVTITVNAAYSGNLRLGIYDMTNASFIGALLAQSAEVVGPLATGPITINLTSPLTVTPGQKVGVGVLLSAAMTNLQTAYTNGYYGTRTYSSGLPTAANTLQIAGGYWFYNVINVTPANAYTVGTAVEDGDTTYAYSATAGQADFYNLSALPYTPNLIHGIVNRAMVRKDNTGTRTAKLQVKSGGANGTIAASGTISLSTTYQYISRIDGTDPNTGAAWTGSALAIGTLQVGTMVVA